MRHKLISRPTRAIRQVVSCLLMGIPLLADSASAQISAPGDFGDYAVGHIRVTPEEDPTLRNLFYLWYPVDPQDAIGASQTHYTLDNLRFPSDHAFDDVPVASGDSLPVVIYYHGSGGWAAMQPTLGETLASLGFVVAGMTQNFSTRSMLDFLDEISARPEHPLYGRIDTNTAGLVGLSAGAGSALTGDADDRVKAVMPISVFATNTRSTKPLFVLTGSLDSGKTSSLTTFGRRQGGDRYFASIDKAGHLSFADWCNRIEYADEHYGPDSIPGVRAYAPQACTDRHIPNEEAVDLTNFYAAAFFGRYLQGNESYSELLTPEYVMTQQLPVDFEAVLADDRAGDANRDGEFNSSDLVQVFQYGLYERQSTATWRSGDWSANARFDSGDLVLAFQEGWYEGPANGMATVPEPHGHLTMTIGLGFVAVLSIRRQVRGRSASAVSI